MKMLVPIKRVVEGASPGDDRSQLVLIPGLLNDADLWRDQIDGLSDLAKCHVADITEGAVLRELAEDVLANASPRFALAGFSLGGYIAQEIARIAPERITRLALLDTSIRADTPERAASRRALGKAARAPGKFHGFGDRLLTAYLDPSHLEDVTIVDRIRAMTERLGLEVFVRQNNVERKDGADILRALVCPVLILCGENDRLTPLADHREMVELAAHARLVVVAGSGHMTPIENPQAVTRALRDWLIVDDASGKYAIADFGGARATSRSLS
jgi:pimeloyl-ACP methyl ester carboxylesterase